MYKVFLVEDDAALSAAIAKHLEAWRYEVVTVQDLSDVLGEFQAAKPHIVLLDIGLPFYDGYYWCEKIREVSSVPIVFLSSASDNMNLVMAIRTGGDDFIAKPFDANVLTAKLQAVLRRTYDMPNVAVLTHRGLTLDLNDFTVRYGDCVTELTKNEFRILETLLHAKGKVVGRDALMIKLWQDDCYVEENTLTVNVMRLRKKLEDMGLHDFIGTKVGRGYIVE